MQDFQTEREAEMPTRTIGMYPLLFIMTVMITFAGCGGDGDRLLIVTVADGPTHKITGVTVVLGDSNGKMITYGTTGANGRIVFSNAPENATVTAAFSCLSPGASGPANSLDVRYDVNGPVTLYVNGCLPPSGPSTGSSDLGTLTLNITNGISGITQYEVFTNYPVILGYVGSTTQIITIRPYDLQSDGKLSIFVIGKDANGASLGYGYLLDQTFIDGMTVNITVDQPLSYFQYHLSNLPPTADSLCTDIYQGRSGKGGPWLIDCQILSSAATSTTVNVPYIPGIGDQFLFSVDVFTSHYDGSTTAFTSQYMSAGPFVPTLSDQNFDFSRALAAPNSAVTGTNTPTPTFSWNGVDPEATMISFYSSLRLSSASDYYLSMYNMRRTRTSITFPELPDFLASFRPTAVASFSVDTATDEGGIFRSSGASYYNFSLPTAGSLLQSQQSLSRNVKLSWFRDRSFLQQAAAKLRSSR